MRRTTATLAIALLLAACGSEALSSEQVRGEQVRLRTVENPQACCILMFDVVDVVADPAFGTAIKGSTRELWWPAGYTAWRVGAEVEVRDANGKVVLVTGRRYWLSPSEYLERWVVGEVRPCPAGGIFVGERAYDCELGGGVL